MAAKTLQNIPDTLHARLEYPAKVHHRSLNSEIIYHPGSVGVAEADARSRNGAIGSLLSVLCCNSGKNGSFTRKARTP